jgi:hypothetical protein
VALLGKLIGGFDLTGYDLDGPLPELPKTIGWVSRQQMMIDIARQHGFSIRQLYQWVATARGHWTVIGTPEQIVDQMQTWFDNGAADGFNVLPAVLPASFDDFVDLVVPELQRRGLFRTRYEGSTLRENLGLQRPANQHVLARGVAKVA